MTAEEAKTAEETKDSTTATDEPATNGAAADEDGAAGEEAGKGGNRKGGKQQQRRNKDDEKPIEELFDLTKPIPRVEKPNKDAHDKEVAALSEKIQALQDQRKEIQEKIDKSMENPASKPILDEKRTALAALKKTKTQLIEEKKALRAQLDRLKSDNEKLLKDKKDAKSNARFGTVQEIDAEIRKLQRRQETTSMSLSEEKKLIKDIDALKASKKFVTDVKSKDAALDDLRSQRKALADQISAKDSEIDAVTPQMDKIMEEMKQINAQDKAKRSNVQELFTERDQVRQQIAEQLKEKDAIRDAFRTANNNWYNYQRALRAQKKIQYEEEKAKREAEKAEYLAKLEAQEAKKIPYEEEQALCDFLADYLERTYLQGDKNESKSDDEDKAKDASDVKTDNDPFAGLTPINKKGEEEYFGKADKKKKKRVRAAKKQDQVTARPFTLSVDTFEQFGLLQLDPPVQLKDVPKAVEELRAKKVWYQQQPRGSVPTAQEIRKQKEVQARQQRDGGAGRAADSNATAPAAAAKKSAAPKRNGKAKFELDSNDFVPLSGSAGAGKGVSNWGPNSTKEAAAATAAAAAVTPTAEGDDADPSSDAAATDETA